jgi:CheY-like chemotaxis protein/transcriptional regulator with XRE-family HTH domain
MRHENTARPDQSDTRPDHIGRRIAMRIRTRRVLMGLSRSVLADRLGISCRNLDACEHAVGELSVTTLSDIAGALQKPIAWFLDPVDDPPRDHRETAAVQPAEVSSGFMELWAGRYRGLPGQMMSNLAHADVGATTAIHTPSARPRVLLVDDAPDVLVVLGAFLDGAGLDVVRARSGDDALQIVAGQERLDAIVTDYAMPGLSGVDLLLQTAQLRPGLPGMIVTGFVDSVGLEVLPKSIEILRKPFRREELVRRVRYLLGIKAAKTTM